MFLKEVKKELLTIKRRLKLIWLLGFMGTVYALLYAGAFCLILMTSVSILLINDFVLVALGAFSTLVTDNIMRNMSFLSNTTRNTKSVYRLNFSGEEVLSFTKLSISLITISALISKNLTGAISSYVTISSFNELEIEVVIFFITLCLLMIVALKFIEYFYSKKNRWYKLDKERTRRPIKYKRKSKH
ncbi:hypothetical protein IGJ34_000081 [Enterococcus sp. AZ177]